LPTGKATTAAIATEKRTRSPSIICIQQGNAAEDELLLALQLLDPLLQFFLTEAAGHTEFLPARNG
jgi:hypothetical protein